MGKNRKFLACFPEKSRYIQKTREKFAKNQRCPLSLFSEHQPLIQNFALESADNLARVGLFCILSIREPFHRLDEYMERVSKGDTSPLWGWKNKAYEDMLADKHFRHRLMIESFSDEDRGLYQVAQWRGFGLAKGGFFLQMVLGQSGCFDSHHVKEFGLKRKDIRFDKPYNTFKQVIQYNELVRQIGGTSFLWDNWCAKRAAENNTTPFAISAKHVSIITGQTVYDLPF